MTPEQFKEVIYQLEDIADKTNNINNSDIIDRLDSLNEIMEKVLNKLERQIELLDGIHDNTSN